MKFFKDWDEVISAVKGHSTPKKVVVAAAQDEHSLQAVAQAAKDGLASPVLVGKIEQIKAIADKFSLKVNQEDLYDVADVEEAARFSVSLVRQGKGDFLMKGILETSQLLKAVVDKEKGLGRGVLMSHMAYYKIPSYHKMLASTDGGMVVYPTLEQKKAILENAVDMLLSMGYERPKVGVLAGVEKVNPKMIETVEGDALKQMNIKGEIKNCIVEGPISLDLALSNQKAVIKKYQSEVAGDVDILLMPNLCTGNCVGKAFTETAGAKMAGLVVGAKAPIVVTSRGASTQDKYYSLTLAAASSG
jgi:phosphate butyryltransferase